MRQRGAALLPVCGKWSAALASTSALASPPALGSCSSSGVDSWRYARGMGIPPVAAAAPPPLSAVTAPAAALSCSAAALTSMARTRSAVAKADEPEREDKGMVLPAVPSNEDRSQDPPVRFVFSQSMYIQLLLVLPGGLSGKNCWACVVVWNLTSRCFIAICS